MPSMTSPGAASKAAAAAAPIERIQIPKAAVVRERPATASGGAMVRKRDANLMQSLDIEESTSFLDSLEQLRTAVHDALLRSIVVPSFFRRPAIYYGESWRVDRRSADSRAALCEPFAFRPSLFQAHRCLSNQSE